MHSYMIQYVKVVVVSRDGASPVTPPLGSCDTHPRTADRERQTGTRLARVSALHSEP